MTDRYRTRQCYTISIESEYLRQQRYRLLNLLLCRVPPQAEAHCAHPQFGRNLHRLENGG